MMAPGIPEVARKYDITNQTLMAMTLSIFLVTFGFGVSHIVWISTFVQLVESILPALNFGASI
jgi:hypothetical protein